MYVEQGAPVWAGAIQEVGAKRKAPACPSMLTFGQWVVLWYLLFFFLYTFLYFFTPDEKHPAFSKGDHKDTHSHVHNSQSTENIQRSSRSLPCVRVDNLS